MKHMKLMALVVAASMTLTACDSMQNQDAGVITGGIVGAVLGNTIGGGDGRTLAIIGGTLIGAFLGGKVGASMDRSDRKVMCRALEKQPTNKSYSWKNPDTNNRYTVTPTKTYYRKGQPCRKFVTTAMVGGKAEKITGRACRRANGDWKIVS